MGDGGGVFRINVTSSKHLGNFPFGVHLEVNLKGIVSLFGIKKCQLLVLWKINDVQVFMVGNDQPVIPTCGSGEK